MVFFISQGGHTLQWLSNQAFKSANIGIGYQVQAFKINDIAPDKSASTPFCRRLSFTFERTKHL